MAFLLFGYPDLTRATFIVPGFTTSRDWSGSGASDVAEDDLAEYGGEAEGNDDSQEGEDCDDQGSEDGDEGSLTDPEDNEEGNRDGSEDRDERDGAESGNSAQKDNKEMAASMVGHPPMSKTAR